MVRDLFHIVLLIFAVLLVCSAVQCADLQKPYKNVSKWRLKNFMISTWGTPVDEDTAKAFADTGFEVVMGNSDMLDICQKYGLKVIVMNANPDLIAKIKNHPAVWGYFAKDEPWNPEQYKEVADKAFPLRAADPTHPFYVNLGGTMEGHPAFLNTVKPDFLSFDYYQWWWDLNPTYKYHYSRLESYRKAALESDLPLLCWVESNADPRWEWGKPGATWLPDNLAKLRHSVYTNLVYGVKGIQWFTAGLAFETKNDRVTPKLQKAGEDIAVLNKEIKVIGKTLVKLTSEKVFHTSPIPLACSIVPINFWAQTSSKNVIMGVFSGPKGETYLMVVNRDWQNPNDIRLDFDDSIKSVKLLNNKTGKWSTLLSENSRGGSASLDLIGGDGALMQVER